MSGLTRVRTRWRLRGCHEVGASTLVWGRVWIHGGGVIRIRAGVTLDARRAPIELHAFSGAELEIGDGAVIEGGTSIEAMRQIRIGARVRIAGFCKLIDSHFHPLRGDRTARVGATPVFVGADAQLGERAVLLPGAFVEPGGVVAPGRVVARRIGRAPAPPLPP